MESRAQGPSSKCCQVFAGLLSNPTVRAKVLLMWFFDLRTDLRRPSVNVLREICLFQGQSAFLPAIWGDRLMLFDLENETAQTETLSQKFSMGARFCLMDPVNVLCVGGSSAQSSVFSASLLDCCLKPKADMCKGRSSPGLIKHRGIVYVFGGATAKGTAMVHCEKFEVASELWTGLPNMQRGKKAFMPCSYEGEIYLADTSPHGLLEVFSPASCQFTVLSTAVPDLLSASVSVVVAGRRMIMTCCQQMAVWAIHKEAQFRLSHMRSTHTLSGTSSVPAMRLGHKVFWVRLGSTGLVIFDVNNERLCEKNFGMVFDE